ncbi:MAG: ATP-dependent DNA helicase PcrA [Candidatus Woesebacteria bacterium GW2011_GWB1_43_14]|uniref:DNA 3'-5' helicase n=1 Tax=Candidatus Woesebacteria bacterium GW2011_GWB1_43_14 TaxID=1618578 RepID=A0A0G1GEZ8_9BACT|nr:MAG: ATP-dependent DNA helicase PcrA [Candidatus Woesebacteria bacterium GW2011_GWA1_39_11b]KKS77978.1 MAG: ATP-dependent DNA helicase PcrA [Candidatus Woesebacteria bacterium GW2011_GWC1_42_9]KKS97443.1 MAG: ATP-dependent DNA helicase PcrA [Candidatus Woesebacteria bacterium GW2011_GWB1_43_14]
MKLAVKSILLANLNEQQAQAVVHEDGPLLILAGAGSGKTRVLTYRAAWLMKEKGVSPDSVLLLTFTNKAASEMKDRILKLTGVVPSMSGTFHSFCVKLLRVEGQSIGIEQNFIIYDESDQKHAIGEILLDLNLSRDSYNPGGVLAQISDAKCRGITPLQYGEIAQGDRQKKIFKIYLEYEKYLLEAGALDFDDLLIKAVLLFTKNPKILSKWQSKLTFVLVDEWQDTNKVQYELTKLLVGKNENITAVGDASQSIYSWRGADYKNIDYLKRDYKNLKIINLEQNYRSTQKILSTANAVISKNSSHPILKLWTKNTDGEHIKLYQAQNGLDEARYIAEKIGGLARTGFNWNDIAVLYRTNAQSRVIEEAMLHIDIPYTIVGGTRFYDRAEIKDILSYLRLVVNPKDTVALKRAQKIGKRRFEKFIEIKGKLDQEQLTSLEILDAVVSNTHYLDKYSQETEENFSHLENIKELRSVAQEHSNLLQFLENISLVQKEQTTSEHDKVTLMTLHAAKGLEFPVVFITGLEEGLFPHSRSLFDREQLEEERRLAYVGITRAKEVLYLTYAERRLYFGQRITNPPSRFLSEIPEDLLDTSDNFSYTPVKEYNFD